MKTPKQYNFNKIYSLPTCFHNFSQTRNGMDFSLEARPLLLPAGFVFPLSTFTQGRTAETPRCPVPTTLPGGVLQGIHDRAASSLQLRHLAHTLTALAIIFTEGLTANKSLLGSGAKIWFPGSAGRKTAAPEHTPSTADVSASENFHLLPSTEVVKDICILCLVKMMTELIKMQLRHFQLLSLSLSQIFS